MALCFHPMAFIQASHYEHIEMLATIFASWAEGRNIALTEISQFQESLTDNLDQDLMLLVNKMIEHGGSSSEVEKFITGNGFIIPDSAKLDKGYHDIFLGGKSLLGSLESNCKNICKYPGKWCDENIMHVFGYIRTITTFILPTMGLITPTAAGQMH